MMNNMTAQTMSLPNLIRSEFDNLDQKVQSLVTDKEFEDIERLFVTGCGDSFYAGLSTRLALKMWTGCAVEVASSLSAGRYNFPYVPEVSSQKDLFIGISVSGGVSRTIEAIQIANQVGGLTLALTGNVVSPLAQAADKILNFDIPDFPPSPGVRTYQVSMMTLFLLGIHFARVKNRISEDAVKTLKRDLLSTADVIEQTLGANEKKVQKLAEQLQDETTFHFVSHGPNLGTACFSAAKLVESAGVYATAQDTEEWAHIEHYTNVNPSVPTFVISPGGRTHRLAAEFVVHMNRLARRVIAVTPKDDQEIPPLANDHLPVIGEVREELSPFVTMLAGELFSAYFADITEKAFFCEGIDRYSGVGDHRKTSIVGIKDLIKK